MATPFLRKSLMSPMSCSLIPSSGTCASKSAWAARIASRSGKRSWAVSAAVLRAGMGKHLYQGIQQDGYFLQSFTQRI